VARGELRPDVDVELANDALAALIYWRMIVTGGRTDRTYVSRLSQTIAAALRGT
ncbi:MAG: TetR/AcrR family transcriptional regulator C-terminal ligand-binding domain-containing protein, partial [Rhodospirillales bacterium]|nr:TetR/AcrR family transcriptional regulator C-terminal ligand-binding domain-containing protein [Acetobacter sp.]